MAAQAAQRRVEGGRRRSAYRLSAAVERTELQHLIRSSGRSITDQQFELLRAHNGRDAFVYCAGDPAIIRRRTVSIVGTRDVSEDGARRAARLARELVSAGVVVMSGLAKGVDTAALSAALAVGGQVAAVIGTPLQKAYPIENADLQTEIAERHLLLSPFAEGAPVFKGNFPTRNRVMALLSDATVIVEASDTSGTLHQAVECLKQKRWLFILRSVVDDPSVSWPQRFLKDDQTVIVEKTKDIIDRL